VHSFPAPVYCSDALASLRRTRSGKAATCLLATTAISATFVRTTCRDLTIFRASGFSLKFRPSSPLPPQPPNPAPRRTKLSDAFPLCAGVISHYKSSSFVCVCVCVYLIKRFLNELLSLGAAIENQSCYYREASRARRD